MTKTNTGNIIRIRRTVAFAYNMSQPLVHSNDTAQRNTASILQIYSIQWRVILSHEAPRQFEFGAIFLREKKGFLISSNSSHWNILNRLHTVPADVFQFSVQSKRDSFIFGLLKKKNWTYVYDIYGIWNIPQAKLQKIIHI